MTHYRKCQGSVCLACLLIQTIWHVFRCMPCHVDLINQGLRCCNHQTNNGSQNLFCEQVRDTDIHLCGLVCDQTTFAILWTGPRHGHSFVWTRQTCRCYLSREKRNRTSEFVSKTKYTNKYIVYEQAPGFAINMPVLPLYFRCLFRKASTELSYRG